MTDKKEKDQIKNYIIIALATIVILLGFNWISTNMMSGGGPPLPLPSQEPTVQPSLPSMPAPPAVRGEVKLEGAFAKGSDNAPVILVEYSDYQCPFCGKFYSQTEGQLIKEYVDTGKVKFIYKDFPLDSIHSEATPAALAARCAGDQGKFWEYHDLIFEGGRQALSNTNYKKWATDLGLESIKFNECLESKKHLSAVRTDVQEGSANGIRGTPGFLIGKGKDWELLSGAQPFSVFKQAIEAKLREVSDSPTGGVVAKSAGDIKEFRVEVYQFGFEPATIEVNQGDTVRIIASSRDVPHGLVIPEFEVNMRLADQTPVTKEFIADKKGTFRIGCNVFCGSGHKEMHGTLIVK